MQKTIVVSLCFLNGKKQRERIRAPHGKAFTASGIDGILNAYVTYVEKSFPGREFNFVPLRDGNVNFVEIEPATAEMSA
jgi:hypothetical protein